MLSLIAKTIALDAAITNAVQLEFLNFDIFDLNPGPIPPRDNFTDPCSEVTSSGQLPWYCFDSLGDIDLEDDTMFVGGEITISCENDDGKVTEVQCNAGTQHCYDNSEHYCGTISNDIVPQEPEIFIDDGGLEFDDDSMFVVGGTITISCENDGGKVTEVQCNAGTLHCYDNSEHYC